MMTTPQARHGTETPATPPMRGFGESLPMALLTARESAMVRFRPLLGANDLTEQQWRVLRALTATTASLEVGELASQTCLLGPSLSRIITNLHQRELIDRRPAPHDQRCWLISLTSAGRDLVTDIAPRSEAAYNEIEQVFGATRLRALLAELAELRAALESSQPAPVGVER